jgi:outer membrane protein, heavy metal efflux system
VRVVTSLSRFVWLSFSSALFAGLTPVTSLSAQVAVATSRPVPSQDTVSVTLADVRRLTLAQSPALLAARQDNAIARGGLQQSRLLLFNPDFSVVAPGPGVGGVRNAAEFSLMQELEIAGQRGLRIGAARLSVARAASTVANTTRLTLADASLAFVRAYSAQRRLQVMNEVLQLTQRLLAAVRVQLGEGEISLLEANLAEIEFGRARARVLAEQRDATSAILDLARLIGVGPDVPLRLIGAPTEPVGPAVSVARVGGRSDTLTLRIDSLMLLGLARRPDVAAIEAAIRENDAILALSRREAWPNLRLGVLAERNQGEDRMRLGPAIGLSVPLFNRSQGLVAQRRAIAQQAVFQREAARLQVRTEIETAVRALTAATAEAAIFDASVREPARANSALLEAAFQAGKIALPTLLLLRNQLLDAELGYWNAWLAREEAQILLDAATGALTAAETPSSRTP